MSNSTLLIYLLPFTVILYGYVRYQSSINAIGHKKLKEAKEAGLSEPVSIHPSINPGKCVGSGACVKACPEQALSMVNGKAMLTDPTHCIGHGACLAACPVEGIELVFGTEKRGMDIPYVSPSFETNVDNIFIAGELGGMGLIRKAAEQGKQTIDSIAKKQNTKNEYDVVIIGAGPAGLSASLAAKDKNLNYITIEQEPSLGGAIYKYPRNKIAMTQPVELPIIGQVEMYDVSKEELLAFWLDVVEQQNLNIQFNERMESIHKTDAGFEIKTANNHFKANTLLLAIGRMGTPRKLGVKGEELPKVVYRLIDPEQYKDKKVLVVGGGDSAIEAALAISKEPNTEVTLSYRKDAFGRIKPKNRDYLETAKAQNKIDVLLKSTVAEINDSNVTINVDNDEQVTIENDGVIICAGGILPTPLLKELGIMVETHYGTSPSKK
jgi:putative YpdA family bacillithiol system oxidoreductase